jgi:excinuclease UvrABC helicase subunit UvrB
VILLKQVLIVATNLLGLGLDIPNVSLVIHIGAPRFLLDFVQEILAFIIGQKLLECVMINIHGR